MKRIAFLVAALLSTRAQAGPASFEADQFHPSDTGGGYLAVDGAGTAPHLGFTVGVWSTWAHRVLVLRDASGNVPPGGEVIGQQLALDLIGSFSILERLELGFDLPYIPRQTVDNSLAMIPGGLATNGLGDLRLDLKVRAITAYLHPQHRLLVAVIAGLRLPTGDSSSFLGQDGVSGYPRLSVEWRHPRASAAINFGAVLRSARSYGDLAVTHQLAWGAAARVVAGAGFEVLGELRGLVGVGLPGDVLTTSETPVELDLGVVWRGDFGLSVSLAGGAGLTRGYGEPDGRIILGVGFASPSRYGEFHAATEPAARPSPAAGPAGPAVVEAPTPPPPPSDRDHDGVPDSHDRCPDQPGPKENDGCPDIDSDGDGLVDRLDKCPFEPEVYNGNADDDGCPDAGAPVLDVALPHLTPHNTFDGTRLDGNAAWKLFDVLSHLMLQHREWPRLVVVCAYGRLDRAAECERRSEAVRQTLTSDFGIPAERLGALTGVVVERKHGIVIQFQIEDKQGANAPGP
jgi:hypothetical protein